MDPYDATATEPLLIADAIKRYNGDLRGMFMLIPAVLDSLAPISSRGRSHCYAAPTTYYSETNPVVVHDGTGARDMVLVLACEEKELSRAPGGPTEVLYELQYLTAVSHQTRAPDGSWDAPDLGESAPGTHNFKRANFYIPIVCSPAAETDAIGYPIPTAAQGDSILPLKFCDKDGRPYQASKKVWLVAYRQSAIFAEGVKVSALDPETRITTEGMPALIMFMLELSLHVPHMSTPELCKFGDHMTAHRWPPSDDDNSHGAGHHQIKPNPTPLIWRPVDIFPAGTECIVFR